MSNLDVADLEELRGHPRFYEIDVKRRGIEFDLLPYCRENRSNLMAYAPLE